MAEPWENEYNVYRAVITDLNGMHVELARVRGGEWYDSDRLQDLAQRFADVIEEACWAVEMHRSATGASRYDENGNAVAEVKWVRYDIGTVKYPRVKDDVSRDGMA